MENWTLSSQAQTHKFSEPYSATETLWSFWNDTIDGVQNYRHDCNHIPPSETFEFE